MAGKKTATQLMRTKLYPPVVEKNRIRRPHLVQAITVQVYFVFRMLKHFFAQFIPDYAQVFSPDAEGTFNCEFVLGWQPNKSGLQLHYKRLFVGDNGTIDQLRVAYTYFFWHPKRD